MYLRESKQRRADGSVVTCLQLAENIWDPEKRRSQAIIVWNCGRADDPAVGDRLRRLAKSILRRASPEEIVADSRDWRLVCAWPHGDVHVLKDPLEESAARRGEVNQMKRPGRRIRRPGLLNQRARPDGRTRPHRCSRRGVPVNRL